MDKGIGLVLGGGGGKGAYQIGVWRAIREFNLENKITAVMGTSVGALNAVLFAENKFDNAEELWNNISQEQFLSSDNSNFKFKDEILKLFKKNLIFCWTGGIASFVFIYNFIKNLISKGILSREGIIKIIDENINLEHIINSKLEVYAICTDIMKNKPCDFLLNQKSPKEIKDILLASSALPIIYPAQKIGNRSYCDGGVSPKANYPIDFLYDKGYSVIISVPLNDKASVNYNKYRGKATIVEIFPEKCENFFNGTLDFTSESAKRRMKQGYEDAKIAITQRILPFYI